MNECIEFYQTVLVDEKRGLKCVIGFHKIKCYINQKNIFVNFPKMLLSANDELTNFVLYIFHETQKHIFWSKKYLKLKNKTKRKPNQNL